MIIISTKHWRRVSSAVVENENHEVQAYIGLRSDFTSGIEAFTKKADELTKFEAESIFPDLSRIVWGKWKKS